MMQQRTSSAFGLSRLGQVIHQCCLWIGVYSIGYCHMDLTWAVLIVAAYFSLQIYVFKKVAEKKQQAKSRFFRKDQVFSQDLPEWVTRPDFQRAEWINAIVAQLWPKTEAYLKSQLKTVENDSNLKLKLARYQIKSIRFPHVSLGSIPPRIGGIKFLQASHRDEAILDLSVQYAGDLSIAVELAVLSETLPKVKASICNFTMTSTQVRVQLRPLLDTSPFVGSIAISFLDTPVVDFDLGGLADVLDMPGLSLLVRHIIRDQLEQTVVMPNSLDFRLVPEDVLDGVINDKEAKRGEAVTVPEGVLSLHIIEAKNLVNKDRSLFTKDKSDPYAKVTVKMGDNHDQDFATEVVQNNLNPVWKMLVDIPVDKAEYLSDVIIEVMDKDQGPNRDDSLGLCTISSQELMKAVLSHGQMQDIWRPLEKASSGSLHLEIGWSELKVPPPEDIPDANGSPRSPHQGVVSVVIDSCSGLEIEGRTGLRLPNPRVKVEVCNIPQYTDPVIGTTDPVFEHRMNFLVNDPRSDKIAITVLDDRATSWKKDRVLGSLRLALSEVLARANNSIAYTVFDLKTKRPSPAKITLSVAFRYIYRPKSRSFGSHHSLEDLQKMQHKRPPAPQQPKVEDSQPLETNFDVDDNEVNTNNGSRPLLEQSWGNGNNGSIVTSSTPIVPKPLHTPKLVHTTLPKLSPIMKKDDGKIQLSLKYNRKTATLSVIVHRIRNVPSLDHTIRPPSAYVKMRLIENIQPGRSFRVSKTKKKTAVKKADLQPVFEETFTYLLPPHELKMRRLELTVCHEGGLIGRTEVLSRCIVPLDSVQSALAKGDDCPTVTDWYRLPSLIKAGSNDLRRSSLSNLTKVQ